MSYIDILELEMGASGEELASVGAVTEEKIEEFERALGLAFPLSYKCFLKKYGALSFAGDTYYGVTNSGVEGTSIPNVVFATANARSSGDADETMIVVKASGYGPIYSIDTSIIGATGEPVIIETELSFKRDKHKKIIYQSFEVFYVDSIRQAIRELGNDDDK
ncbi:SMI1/KNR4 family protein [Pseudomonas sp. CC120222-01a]|uniref:SMI1/KNR4 family protein n=1 Tax=Pseudomonas sp. CC120222-01a TaxID=1378075 RepID=UPI000DA12343|nr:SMI1/KNR4 family protein [Pseudomonas sp. CC120222-01a]